MTYSGNKRLLHRIITENGWYKVMPSGDFNIIGLDSGNMVSCRYVLFNFCLKSQGPPLVRL